MCLALRISKYLLPGKIFVRDINFKNSEFTKGIFVNISLNKKKGCVKNLKKTSLYAIVFSLRCEIF